MENSIRPDIDESLVHVVTLRSGETPAAASLLLEHWLIIKPWWRRIVLATALGVIITFLLCAFVLTKWYQATAMLRPASQQGPTAPLSSIMGSISVTGVLGNMFGPTGLLSGSLPPDVAEYGDLLQSYEFTSALIRRHNLGPVIDRGPHYLRNLVKPVLDLFASRKTDRSEAQLWLWYLKMQTRFNVDYDDKRGTLTITFLDQDRGIARQILGFYIDDLREKLRKRTIRETTATIKSLQDALQRTSDPLVQQQVAQIVAQQILHEQTAQAEADFAFSVTDSPFVDIYAYKPKAILLSLLAGLLIPFLAFVILEIRANVYVPFRTAEHSLELGNANGFDSQEQSSRLAER